MNELIKELNPLIRSDTKPLTEGIEKSFTKDTMKLEKEGVPPPPPQPIKSTDTLNTSGTK